MISQNIASLCDETDAAIREMKLTEEGWDALLLKAKEVYRLALECGDETLANKGWFMFRSCETVCNYIAAFRLMKNSKYYEAWCALERVEIDVRALKRNNFLDIDAYGIDFIESTVRGFQSLFPYKVFFSPEFLQKRVECSICGESQNPWSTCTHEAGRVYGGRECIYIVKDFEIIGISMVLNPVQKYSVAMSHGEDGKPFDHYDYTIVKFVVDRLQSPFDGWTAEWVRAYHPHELFPEVEKTAPCPCGSGKNYDDCCAKRTGVIRPHLDVHFAIAPPEDLPCVQFVSYETE